MNMHTYKGGFRRRDTARGHPSNPSPLSLFNGRWVKVALDGGTRPGDTLQIHPHFLSLMGDGQANAFRWRDTSPWAALSVVLCIT